MSQEAMSFLARGAWVTFQVTIFGFLASLVCSAISGFASLSRNVVIRAVNEVYILIFRGTSAIVQVFFIFFVLPLFGVSIPPMTAAILILALNFGAFGSQIVRTTILSVDKGQREAAIALNMTTTQSMRRIIVPQALIPMIPLFGNELVMMLKATPILSAVSIPELTYEAKALIANTGESVVVYSALLVLYFIAGYPLTLAVRYLDDRISARYGVPRGLVR
jgi:polar amino acid transport system permease protein